MFKNEGIDILTRKKINLGTINLVERLENGGTGIAQLTRFECFSNKGAFIYYVNYLGGRG